MQRTPHTKKGGASRRKHAVIRDIDLEVKDEGVVSHEKTFVKVKESEKSTSQKSKVTSSTSLARKKQLEYEAAQVKALIDLEAARAETKAAEDKAQAQAALAEARAAEAKAKAHIERQLLEKKLEADIAGLSDSRSNQSSEQSCKSKVVNWLQGSCRQEGHRFETVAKESISRCNNEGSHSVLSSKKSHISEVASHNSAAYSYTRRHQQLQRDDIPDPPRTEIEKFTEAIRDVLRASSPKIHNKELLTRLATSKDLPLYFGDAMEWLQFKEAFYESTALCNYSDTENLWRLRKCLRGQAKEAVSSLMIGATSPSVIMETLELRFGSAEIIMSKISTQLKKLQPLPHTYHNEIVNFSIKIKNYVAAAKAINQQDYLRSPELSSILLSKFPTTLLGKWSDFYYDRKHTEESKLEQLATFLHLEAVKCSSCGVSNINIQHDVRKKIEKPQYPCVLLASASATCKFCRKGTHGLHNCGRFKRALRKDRWRFVRTNKLCYKCLQARHSEECSADNCDVEECGQPHHRLLHWTKPAAAAAAVDDAAATLSVRADDEHAQEAGAVARATVAHCSDATRVLLKVVPVTIHGPDGSVHVHALLDDGATVTLVSGDVADQVGVHGKTVLFSARGAWDSCSLKCETEVVNFDISNSEGERFSLSARKISELNLPVQSVADIDFNNYEYINKDYNLCKCDVQPKLLIGQDNYHLIAPSVCIGRSSGPYVTKTSLGWCLHGPVCKVSTYVSADRLITLSQPSNAMTPPPQGSDVCYARVETVSHLFNKEIVEMPPRPSHSLCYNTQQLSTVDYIKYDMQLHDEVRLSFALDAIGITHKPRENPNDLRAISILDKTSVLTNGQWTVGLPWKCDDFTMPDSYATALKRLKSVERKMSINDEYALRYRERVQHLFTNNYAREVHPEEITDHVWYLPHFGVDNQNKKKLRLVYDAAAKSHGHSLNDFLLQGPDLLPSLYGIMLRFREHPIGIIGDIKDMFLRIKIRQEDQYALRFLWRDSNNSQSEIKKYAMTALIFGANCSPFVAQYINKNKNALRFESEMPDAVHGICNSQYMDDYIDSLENELITLKRIKDVSYIHQQGGFEMRNWMSNCANVLKNTPAHCLSDKAVKFDLQNQPERTLGLLWHPYTDTLSFDLSLKRIPIEIQELKRKPTKRELLRIVMSIFDIHGFLAPFTIKSKILMQETWKTDIKWDEEINETIFVSFGEWINQLKNVSEIRIPRWYFRQCTESSFPFAQRDVTSIATSASEITLQLHVFCDASPSAYAAVGYWRKECSDGSIYVSFICSKSRVAPLKSVSIPRLELQGALLACRLAETIKKEHRIKTSTTHYWTDSTTVLWWIRNNTRKYKVFIANRLSEIDDLSKQDEWRYVPSEQNIADIATKNNSYILKNNCEWFTGPSFLSSSPSCWPQEPENKNTINNEICEEVNYIYENNNNNKLLHLPVPEPSRFSTWLRLLRCTATVLLFIEKCKQKKKCDYSDEIMKKAEMMLLRYSQAQSFLNEINLLKEKKCIKRDSRLRELTPVLDEKDLLRVGGRIDTAMGIARDMKRPIILDGRDYISQLIVKMYHVRAAHACNELVVNELKQKYWILKLRPTVRSVASRCLVCKIRKARPAPPRLGDLPAERLAHHQRPFTMCGVDLFGPMEVTVGRQKPKRYGVLFTCMTIRAIHVEIVSSLTADSLIMALRRMAARRGWPHTILSDNGTNLRGANIELKKAREEVDTEALVSQALNAGVNWRFISPVSPHMGGAWERLIRSVKTALRVVLKERSPKEEVLTTFLAEVENIINSRPLTHVSVDPGSDEALTPNHFLIGSSSNLPIPGRFDDSDLYLRRQWRIAQRLADLFWSRWMKEFLPLLLPRRKWHEEGVQLKIGDVVIVTDPSLPRNTWPKGIVVGVFPGSDGRIRVVDVKTERGVMKRPVTRVALLSFVNDECRDSDTRGEDVDDGHL